MSAPLALVRSRTVPRISPRYQVVLPDEIFATKASVASPKILRVIKDPAPVRSAQALPFSSYEKSVIVGEDTPTLFWMRLASTSYLNATRWSTAPVKLGLCSALVRRLSTSKVYCQTS